MKRQVPDKKIIGLAPPLGLLSPFRFWGHKRSVTILSRRSKRTFFLPAAELISHRMERVVVLIIVGKQCALFLSILNS